MVERHPHFVMGFITQRRLTGRPGFIHMTPISLWLTIYILCTIALICEYFLLIFGEIIINTLILFTVFHQSTVEMAERHPRFVMGFITQRRLTGRPGFIHMTPGVKMGAEGDGLGQQYNTPRTVILDRCCDVIIVGRGVYQAENMVEAAKLYRQQGWEAYEERLRKWIFIV